MKKGKTRSTKHKKSDLRKFIKEISSLDRKLIGVFLVTLVLTLFLAPGSKGAVIGVSTEFFDKPIIREDFMSPPVPALYPKKMTDVPTPAVSAQSAIVLDVSSQVVLYQKNQDTSFPLASTTKLMTALVGMDMLALDDIVTVPSFSVEGAKIGLVPYEQISFENLLYGLLLASGNDCAETIARAAGVGYDGFIAAMNKKARELNLANTHFEDPTGLSAQNDTSAIDLARLASFALKNQGLAKIVSTKNKITTDVSGEHVYALENLNKLLGTVPGVIGMKTGFTEEAGQVLVTAATRDGNTIVTVVLKSEDRFLDSKNLLEWAFANHKFIEAKDL